jgi:hypothetical protein
LTPQHAIFVEPHQLIRVLEDRVEGELGEDAVLLSRLRALGHLDSDYNLAMELKNRPADAGLRRDPLSLKEALEFHLATLTEAGRVFVRKDKTRAFIREVEIETFSEECWGGRAFLDPDGEDIFWVHDWIS